MNWGLMTRGYYKSVKKRGPEYTTDTIKMARQFLKDQNLQGNIKATASEDDVDSLDGERALLCKCDFCAAYSTYTFNRILPNLHNALSHLAHANHLPPSTMHVCQNPYHFLAMSH